MIIFEGKEIGAKVIIGKKYENNVEMARYHTYFLLQSIRFFSTLLHLLSCLIHMIGFDRRMQWYYVFEIFNFILQDEF